MPHVRAPLSEQPAQGTCRGRGLRGYRGDLTFGGFLVDSARRRLGLAGLALLLLAPLASLALLPLQAAAANAATLGYARAFTGSTGSDLAFGDGIAVDGTGAVVTVGQFAATVDFDPGSGALTRTSAFGSRDAYVRKLNASGNAIDNTIFVQNGNLTDTAAGIAVDGSGNAYVVGQRAEATPDYRYQAYAVKLDSVGNVSWIRYITGPGAADGSAIAIDGAGAVYLAGSFSGTVDFDPGAGTAELTSAGHSDAFVVKLTSSGDLVWVHRFRGTDTVEDVGIAVDAAGAVYVTGGFFVAADFDPGHGSGVLTSDGSSDAFAVKLSASGDFVWAKRFGGLGRDSGRGIAVDATGAIYLTGYFQNTVDFDPGPGTANLTSTGSYDVFIVKLNSSGDLVWANRLGGSSFDFTTRPAVDSSGNVYLTGNFSGTMLLDPSPGIVDLTSAGSSDVFVIKLDSSGAPVWAKGFGGTYSDYGAGVAVDGAGSVYVTGSFEDTVDFDPGPGFANMTSNVSGPHYSAAFVVKLVQIDPPVNGLPTAQTTADDTPLVFSTARGNRISVADPDNGSSPLRVTLTVNSGALSLATTTGLTFTVGDGASDATMTFSGALAAINRALDGLSYTPVLGAPSSATLQVTTQDLLGPSGGQTDADSLAIAIGRRPVAVNDSYSLNSSSSLNVPAATGVLANDTDADTPAASLQAQVVTGPSRGTVALQPNGAFTYTPASSTTGTDTFTYTVHDPQGLTSSTATVTLNITGVACGPRPSVRIATTVVNGALQATITASDGGAPTNNRLQTLQFGAVQNAAVTLNGQPVVSGQTVTLPANTTNQQFTVRRVTPGQATTVPFTVVDSCGSWPSFVGGGPGAGF